MISAETVRAMLNYDPATGVFTWRVRPSFNVEAGSIAGSIKPEKDGRRYRQIRILNRIYLAHRLAWFYVHSEWPTDVIDHINSDGLDNRMSNLRSASLTQNHANKRQQSNNTSGVKGVSWNKAAGKWRAHIQLQGTQLYLGSFADKADAAEAYRRAAIEAFGEFANPVGAP